MKIQIATNRLALAVLRIFDEDEPDAPFMTSEIFTLAEAEKVAARLAHGGAKIERSFDGPDTPVDQS